MISSSFVLADGDPTPTFEAEEPITLLRYGNWGGTGYLLFYYFDPSLDPKETQPTITPNPEATKEENPILGYTVQLLDREVVSCTIYEDPSVLYQFKKKEFDQEEVSYFIHCDLLYYFNTREWSEELMFDGED